MTKISRAPQTDALLTALLPPAGATAVQATDELYTAMGQLHELLESVQYRVMQIERLRRAADVVEDNEQAYFFFERVKSKCTALLNNLQVALASLDTASDTAFQLDKYALEVQAAFDAREGQIKVLARNVLGPTVPR